MKLSLISLFVVLTGIVYSQQDLNLNYMNNVPQSLYLNPAFKPLGKVNIGLPAISSIYFDHINTTFTPNNLFETSSGQTTLAIDNLKGKIGNNNYFGATTRLDLLSFGFKAGKNYFSFNATENVFFRLNLSRGFLELPLYGNADFDHHGGNIDMSNTGVNFTHYREYGLGWQREVSDKLNIGVKAKLLVGNSNLWTKTNTFNLQTNQDTYDWSVSGQFEGRSSGFDSSSFLMNEDVEGYLLNNKNKGAALDMGATYQLTKKINVNASIIDLGFIRWNSDNFNVNTNDASFEFKGLDLTEVIYAADSVSGDSLEAVLDRLTQSAENELSYSENNDAYTKMLMARIHLGGTYQLYEGKNSKGKAGILIQSEFYNRTLRPSFTFSYNQSVGRWFQAAVSYSMVNRGFNNLGVGLSLNLGPIQVYGSMDNVLATRLTAFQENSNTAFAYPTNSKKTHVHAGVNFTFGRERKDTDKDGISDDKDKCPDVFGLKEFDGCPDTDADGCPDWKDECPEISGKINGCPDSDSDGILDKNDACPEVKGIAEFNGCPDTDKDGVEDKNDKCPVVAGSKEFDGCPDSDGDKIIDEEDNCPLVAGPIENNGCPWGDSDNDNVKDNVDKCPEVAGPIENDGCPYTDKDNDGVLDKDDACPELAGVQENNGCPEIAKEEQEVLKRAFDNLEFETGKDVIKSNSYASLKELALLLVKKKEWNLKISGHTDNVGDDNANMNLSKSRSIAVKKYLVERGIKEERLITLWFGETQPLQSNDTPEGRQKNRRVEMNIQF